MQILAERMLFGDAPGSLPLVGKVDNTQAISAVHKGYSKKLNFLERTHRCASGALHEMIVERLVVVEHAPTDTHRADGFTNMMPPNKFAQARELMGIRLNTAAP